MQALPGVGDLSEYGIKAEDSSGESNADLDALREKREREGIERKAEHPSLPQEHDRSGGEAILVLVCLFLRLPLLSARALDGVFSSKQFRI